MPGLCVAYRRVARNDTLVRSWLHVRIRLQCACVLIPAKTMILAKEASESRWLHQSRGTSNSVFALQPRQLCVVLSLLNSVRRHTVAEVTDVLRYCHCEFRNPHLLSRTRTSVWDRCKHLIRCMSTNTRSRCRPGTRAATAIMAPRSKCRQTMMDATPSGSSGIDPKASNRSLAMSGACSEQESHTLLLAEAVRSLCIHR